MGDSPLLRALKIVEWIGDGFRTSAAICQAFGISDATLKRAIAEARELDADLVSRRQGNEYGWTVANWADIEQQGRLAKWIELEEERRLT